MLRLCLVLFLAAAAPAETVNVQITRLFPKDIPDNGLKRQEDREIALTTSGCDGKVRLRRMRYELAIEIHEKEQAITISMHAEADIEKLAAGPLAAPALTIEGNKPLTVVLEGAYADAKWERTGAFTETIRSDGMTDANQWKSIALRCSGESPYHSAVIPEGVVYNRAADDVVAAAVAKLDAALRGETGFGMPSLYDPEAMIIGPDLFNGIGKDPALQDTSSPKMVTIDPQTKKQRGMLRIKGAEEAAKFGAAMRRYLGDAKPRIRAATAAELSRYWLNIGWDIEEPLLIADFGAHRIVLDFDAGVVSMVDEIPAE